MSGPSETPHVRRGVTIPLSIAPMMDRTDRHCRFFLRVLSRRILLYTEMITSRAILHGDRDTLLGYDQSEHPVALQLGGDDPAELARCAAIGEEWGYDEINLNVGCPSPRVSTGSFGACLMKRPEQVARIVGAMREATSLPVTVKHRIGVDDLDRYEDMANFVEVVQQAGADRFSVHARKAWLKGLSPKQNRNVPPLRYEEVYRLKQAWPEQVVEINGGIDSWPAIHRHLEHVDAVMIGRAAYRDPWLLQQADSELHGEEPPVRTRREAVEAMLPYLEARLVAGDRASQILRHLIGLFVGQPGSGVWKRRLSEAITQHRAGPEALEQALCAVEEAQAEHRARRERALAAVAASAGP